MKKPLILFALLLSLIALTGCSRNKQVFEAYYFVESFQDSGSSEFKDLDLLDPSKASSFKSYILTLDTKDQTFEIREEPFNGDIQIYTGTFTKQGDQLTFYYEDEFSQVFEREFGHQVYEYRENGKELYFYQYRNKEIDDQIMGPITVKFRLK